MACKDPCILPRKVVVSGSRYSRGYRKAAWWQRIDHAISGIQGGNEDRRPKSHGYRRLPQTRPHVVLSLKATAAVTLRNLPDELYCHFYGPANVKSLDTRSYFADGDDTWFWDALVIVAIKDREIGAGRPVGDLSDGICVLVLTLIGEHSRQVSKFLSSAEIVHRQRKRQQRNEIAGRAAVDQ